MEHPAPDELVAYLAGPKGSPREEGMRERIEAHAAQCQECRGRLGGLGLAQPAESPEERAILQRLGAPRGLPSRKSQPSPWQRISSLRLPVLRLPVWTFAAVPALALLVFALQSPQSQPAEALLALQGESRPLEPAISGLPYAPYQPQRGAQLQEEARFDKALRALLEAREKSRPGAEPALAMLFLLRGGPGDGARADKVLAAAGTGADAENDRGVLLHSRGDYPGALDAWDRALERDPLHRAARFNRGLALSRLGLRDAARAWFEKTAADDPGSPWAAEARARALRLGSREADEPARPASLRAEALRALFGAQDKPGLLAAQAKLLLLPQGQVLDLLALAKWAVAQPEAWAAEHGLRWRRYLELRGRAVGSGLEVAEALAFAQEAAGDRLLWAPALQLAGFVQQARGQWRPAQALDAQLVAGCRKLGCAVENQAIALDELADWAGRDGDFAEARKLMLQAESLLIGVDAEPQLAELHRKRAGLLLEEKRVEEAAQSSSLALRELSAGTSARVMALLQAGAIEVQRGHRRAAADLNRAALELAHALGARDLETDAAAELAQDELELGRAADARAMLSGAIQVQEENAHPLGAAALLARLAQLELSQGEAAAALAASQRGLEAARSGAFTSTRLRLQLAHARALRAQGREAEGKAELAACVHGAAREAAGSQELFAAAALAQDESAREAAAELAISLARSGAPPEELVLPLDELRAASLHAQPAAKGWSQALPQGACVLALLPSARYTLAVLVARDGGGGFHLVSEPGPPERALQAGLAQLPLERLCERELWLMAEPPLDALALLDLPWQPGSPQPLAQRFAAGIATTLTRLLAPEPPARAGLIVHDVQARGDAAGVAVSLPATQRERAAVAGLFGSAAPAELAGDRATPAAALESAPGAQLLHFAVHGFDPGLEEGGFLQLAQAQGDGGRLTAREVATARLLPGTRVVLSACNAASGSSRGLGWAFARAGAVAVAAARDRVDDEAAAVWSERFYAALARGAPFVQANHEAATAVPRAAGEHAALFVVVK